jgi:hypothetical protein
VAPDSCTYNATHFLTETTLSWQLNIVLGHMGPYGRAKNEVIFSKSPMKTYMQILQGWVENEKSKPAGIIQAAFIYHQFPNTPFLSF